MSASDKMYEVFQFNDIDKALKASCPIEAGAIVGRFEGRVLDHPLMHTVQVAEGRHIDSDNVLIYCAHSCAPNATLRFPEGLESSYIELVALKDVGAGEPPMLALLRCS